MEPPTNPRHRLVNRKLNPLLETLPSWVEGFRPQQIEAVNQIMAAFEDVDVVVLDAPTGTGKTLIAETVGRMLGDRGERDETGNITYPYRRRMYVCSSKSLQDQFVRDYPYGKVIKGRSNYPTQNFAKEFFANDYRDRVSCEDCTWDAATEECTWCDTKHTCPYELAKTAAIRGELVIANTAYALAEWNHVGKLHGRGLVIADEADEVESSLMGFVSVDVSARRMKKLGWRPPEKVTVVDSWVEWIDEKLPMLVDVIHGMHRNTDKNDVAGQRELKYLSNLAEGLRKVKAGIEAEEPWVYTGEGGARDKDGLAVSFKPSRVDKFGDMLWPHGRKWLLMSATVISSSEMMQSLGWGDRPYRYVGMGSSFPLANRPIYPVPVAVNSNKNKDVAREMIAAALVVIARRHPDERILVHSVSYDFTQMLWATLRKELGISRKIIHYMNAADREGALAAYKAAENAVLIAPSMERGVDLPGDLCRVQVITKVPFPYLGDRQVSTRLHSPGGQIWYNVQTVRSLVQMTGRGVRSETDHAVTYVLDAQFRDMVWSKNKGLLPKWWADSVRWQEGRQLTAEIVGVTRGATGATGR